LIRFNKTALFKNDANGKNGDIMSEKLKSGCMIFIV